MVTIQCSKCGKTIENPKDIFCSEQCKNEFYANCCEMCGQPILTTICAYHSNEKLCPLCDLIYGC